MAFTPLTRLSLMSARSGDLFGGDLAVDLGTANTLVYARGRGIMLNEPSIITINTSHNVIVTINTKTKRMIGHTPNHILTMQPLQNNIITNYNITTKILHYFIHKILRQHKTFTKPRIIVCVPSKITNIKQQTINKSIYTTDTHHIHIINKPITTTINTKLPINQPSKSIIININGGTTEVAILALNGIVASTSLQIAGNTIDATIVEHVRSEFQLLIKERTAEELKISVGSTFPVAKPKKAEIRDRNVSSGLPHNVTVSNEELRKTMDEPVSRIVNAVRSTLDRCPPKLAGNLITHNIVLTNGNTLLHGLDARLQHKINIPMLVADHPLNSIVLKTATIIEHFNQLQKIVINNHHK